MILSQQKKHLQQKSHCYLKNDIGINPMCAPFAVLFLSTTLLFGLSGCQQSNNKDSTNVESNNLTESEKKQIPEVEVFKVNYTDVPKTINLDGEVVAYQTAEVRPQIAGILVKKLFLDGSYVQKDQPLFRVDAQDYETAVTTQTAMITRHKANLRALVVKRNGVVNNSYIPTHRESLSSNQRKQLLAELDTQIALAKSEIILSKSLLTESQQKLERAIIRAPISGKTSLSDVAAGSFVSSNQDKPLVFIYQMNPIYVDMQQPIAQMRDNERLITEGILQNLSAGSGVRLQFADGQKYADKGRITFSAANINQENKAVKVRAVFNNDDRELMPGMKITARVKHGEYRHAFVLPASAVVKNNADDKLDKQKSDKQKPDLEKQSNLKQKDPTLANKKLAKYKTSITVLIVKDNKLHKKELQVKELKDEEGNYIITKGLNDGDVVVKNANNLNADMQIKPVFESEELEEVDNTIDENNNFSQEL